MKILVIGVGNGYRRDDAVGLIVARSLREKALADLIVVEHSGEGAQLMEAWTGASTVIIVDAVQSGGNPGTIYRFDADKKHIPTKFFHYTSHAFNVAEAVELARALKQLPARLAIYGIEGKDFEAGQRLSSEVAKASTEVVERILREIDVYAKLPAPSQSGS